MHTSQLLECLLLTATLTVQLDTTAPVEFAFITGRQCTCMHVTSNLTGEGGNHQNQRRKRQMVHLAHIVINPELRVFFGGLLTETFPYSSQGMSRQCNVATSPREYACLLLCPLHHTAQLFGLYLSAVHELSCCTSRRTWGKLEMLRIHENKPREINRKKSAFLLLQCLTLLHFQVTKPVYYEHMTNLWSQTVF